MGEEAGRPQMLGQNVGFVLWQQGAMDSMGGREC